MKSSRAIARQTRAAEGTADRVEELHQLVSELGEQLTAVQGQLAELAEALTRPAAPAPAAPKK